MPELPEVETIVRELNGALPGRRIRRVQVFRADALGGVPVDAFRARLEGAAFRRVTRRGKFLLFELEPAGWLVGHLRMTGKFAVSPPLPAPLPYHRAWFELEDGALLVFQDLRCFGTLAAVERLEDYGPLAALGVDPLSRRFTAHWLAQALAASRTPVKHWLMDQSKLAGLGNIYVAEILYAARLSPLRMTNTLRAAEVERLYRATRRILRKAIHKSGTTIRDFRRVDEQTGEFQNFLRVYGKAGQPCPSCRTPIARVVQQQRSTFYCPTCQR
jgi:formamidopyrimidine-DNA glycosylase